MKITLKETHKSIYELVSLFKTKITKNYRKQHAGNVLQKRRNLYSKAKYHKNVIEVT